MFGRFLPQKLSKDSPPNSTNRPPSAEPQTADTALPHGFHFSVTYSISSIRRPESPKQGLLEIVLRPDLDLDEATAQIVLAGKGLHAHDRQVSLCFHRRMEGEGIRFFVPDGRRTKTIEAVHPSLVPNLSRMTALQDSAGKTQLQIPEHLLAALRHERIADIDIHVRGQSAVTVDGPEVFELPILKGSVIEFVKALRELDVPRRSLPLRDIGGPVVFYKNPNTFMLLLPTSAKSNSSLQNEFFHLVTLPLETVPHHHYFRHLADHGGDDFLAVASCKTFLERNLHAAKSGGSFLGGRPDVNMIAADSVERRRHNLSEFLPEDLAGHKICDINGDMYLAELTAREWFKLVSISVGTGHQDHHLAFGALLGALQGRGSYSGRDEVKKVREGLKLQHERGLITGEHLGEMLSRLSPFC